MSALPWFRLYHRMIDDDRLRLLAFEDRWHFVAVLCLKAAGLIDDTQDELWERRMSVKLGLQTRELEELQRRLMAVGLIDDQWQPIKWDDLQCRSDSSVERTRKYRRRQKSPQNQRCEDVKRHSDVTVTPQIREDKIREEEPKGSSARCAKPDDVSDEVWQDFKRHRQKRGGISNRVIAGFRREAERAGWTLEQAMDESITQGWRGFKADYVKNKQVSDRGGSLADIGDEVRKLYGY